jgi:hypothetical protein
MKRVRHAMKGADKNCMHTTIMTFANPRRVPSALGVVSFSHYECLPMAGFIPTLFKDTSRDDEQNL